jgi:hypothetical protein
MVSRPRWIWSARIFWGVQPLAHVQRAARAVGRARLGRRSRARESRRGARAAGGGPRAGLPAGQWRGVGGV